MLGRKRKNTGRWRRCQALNQEHSDTLCITISTASHPRHLLPVLNLCEIGQACLSVRSSVDILNSSHEPPSAMLCISRSRTNAFDSLIVPNTQHSRSWLPSNLSYDAIRVDRHVHMRHVMSAKARRCASSESLAFVRPRRLSAKPEAVKQPLEKCGYYSCPHLIKYRLRTSVNLCSVQICTVL